jgi:MbtH protein
VTWDSEDTVYNVVVNDEAQYAIWPQHKDIPAGWRATGTAGKKADCLTYIKEVWTDMRPKSLQEEMVRA